MRFVILSLIGLVLGAASFVDPPPAKADPCLYSTCGGKQRLFGPDLRRSDPYRSPNDLYNERNQDRYRSGIKAKPFDFGSSTDATRPLGSAPAGKTGNFNGDQPQARSEHVRWCLARYKSYAVATNTYVTYDGRTRFCDSPFR
ncbi:BA14K family protein [Taklimakanibacter lacteus]|uniref:BA14K family protein n=1 Tax=Taklimakanibacter lacteus TaxID=2268456 RepID=UPI000E674265